jgi:hypothetical protein
MQVSIFFFLSLWLQICRVFSKVLHPSDLKVLILQTEAIVL